MFAVLQGEEECIRYCQYFEECLFQGLPFLATSTALSLSRRSSFSLSQSQSQSQSRSSIESGFERDREWDSEEDDVTHARERERQRQANLVWQKLAPSPVQLGGGWAVVSAHYSDPFTGKAWNPNRLLPYAPVQTSRAADIWAVGLIVFHLLSRSLSPLLGRDVHCAERHREYDFVTDTAPTNSLSSFLSRPNGVERLLELKQFKLSLFFRKMMSLSPDDSLSLTSLFPSQSPSVSHSLSFSISLLEQLLHPDPKRRVSDLSLLVKAMDEHSLRWRQKEIVSERQRDREIKVELTAPLAMIETLKHRKVRREREREIQEKEIFRQRELRETEAGVAEGKGVPRLGGQSGDRFHSLSLSLSKLEGSLIGEPKEPLLWSHSKGNALFISLYPFCRYSPCPWFR
jgi:serine/threonine protein kinase